MENSNLGKVVKFTNITDKDFTHAFGGVPFFVKAGETVMLPWDLADHLATHLSRRIFLDADTSPTQYLEGADKTGGMGKPLWNDETEKAMKLKILGEVFESATPAPKSEIEQLREKVEALAKQFGLASPVQNPANAPVVASNEAANINAQDLIPESQKPELSYKDKAEIIAQLKAKGIPFDARQGKGKLETLLATQGVTN